MSIVEKIVLDDVVQADGRRSLRLQWVAHTGEKITLIMLVASNFNVNSALIEGETEAVKSFEIAEKEGLEEKIREGISFQTILDNLNHLTTKKVLLHLVKLLMLTDDPRVIITLKTVVSYIKNNFTDAQIRNTLGITQPQLVIYKERIASVLTDTGNTLEGYINTLDNKKDPFWEDV